MTLPLWALAALTAALLQTLRNATQSSLIKTLGTLGATQVRFLFGLPFALLFLGCIAWGTGEPIPSLSGNVLLWALMGGLAQILATALMLIVMKSASFSVTTAWLKGEPALVALIGLPLLGDAISGPMLIAIALAISGVLILSIKPGTTGADLTDLKPAALGLMAGALFGLSAVGFRGAILALTEGSYLIRALSILALSLLLQSAILFGWMLIFKRSLITDILRTWKPSLMAGVLGASASAGWFIAFSMTTAANVRTVALTEIIFALLVGRFWFRQSISPRQLLGITVLLGGVAILLI